MACPILDPDKTAKIRTIPRCKPRDPWDETLSSLRRAQSFAPASSIRESIEQLLREIEQKESAA